MLHSRLRRSAVSAARSHRDRRRMDVPRAGCACRGAGQRQKDWPEGRADTLPRGRGGWVARVAEHHLPADEADHRRVSPQTRESGKELKSKWKALGGDEQVVAENSLDLQGQKSGFLRLVLKKPAPPGKISGVETTIDDKPWESCRDYGPSSPSRRGWPRSRRICCRWPRGRRHRTRCC
jgi:hypothetical protein